VENQKRKITMKLQNLIHILIGIVCIGLLPKAQAVVPTPDGGYTGANTAEGGSGALFSLTAGTNNTALGAQALFSLTTGNQNTATGSQALKNNTANNNTADGFQALVNNTTGIDNTAIGWRALFNNTTGPRNTAIGYGALYRNGITGDNTAVGYQAQYLSDGVGNTSIGYQALYHNGNDNNTAVGLQALFNNNGGIGNIGLGAEAGVNITDGSENIDIGNAGVSGDSNIIRIGTSGTHMATFIAGISGTTIPAGVAVVVDGNGQLGIGATSSQRFKDAIKPMDKASESLLALKPVTFRYAQEIDPKRIPQFGLVAEEVEKVNPDLVTRDTKGEVYTVRYEAVNAMLLNEFLKAHRKMEEQEATIARLKSTVAKQETAAAHQQEQIEALTAGLQKLSAQLEASKSATQLVNNNQ
jgi:uncharacterized coiled-coil protein SlyX